MASLTLMIMIKACGDTDKNVPPYLPLKIFPGKTWTDISSMAMAKTKAKLASAKQGKWQAALRKQQPKMTRGGT